MASVFAPTQKHKGSFRADLLNFQFGDISEGHLVQNVNAQFQQSVSLLFELGKANVYYVGGRAQGQATIGRIIGPVGTAAKLFSSMKDICHPDDIDLSWDGGCTGSGGSSQAAGGYTLVDAVMTSVGIAVTANDVVINESLGFMFIDMTEGSGSPDGVDGNPNSVAGLA